MKDNERKPVFYSILKAKDTYIYDLMFHIINVETDGMKNKEYIMGDFEIMNFGFLICLN